MDKTRLKIGLAIETDGPGGAETVLLSLAGQLREMGHHIVCVGPLVGERWLSQRFESMGFLREAVDLRGFNPKSVLGIRRVVQDHGLDVLHSHEFTMAVYGSIALRGIECRHVITMHGGTYAFRKLRRRVALRAAIALSCPVAVSEASRREMARHLMIREPDIDVVHNGVSPPLGRGDAVRRELGLSSDDVLILAIGNLYPVKGHRVLLDAVSHLKSALGGSRTVLTVIAGRGDQEGPLRHQAAEAEISGFVKLLGFREDVPDLLAAADVLAMPSLSEGLPMAIIEAMLAGVPIVATDVGGVRELIPNADYGSLVQPGNPEAFARQLWRFINAPSIRSSVGSAAQRRAIEHFSAEAMTRKYLSTYLGC